jgi:hypothetical protein
MPQVHHIAIKKAKRNSSATPDLIRLVRTAMTTKKTNLVLGSSLWRIESPSTYFR